MKIILFLLFLFLIAGAFDLFTRKSKTTKTLERKKYKSLDDWKRDLFVIWNKNPVTISFDYEKPDTEGIEKRTIRLMRAAVTSNRDLYFMGICKDKNEMRFFHTDRIISKITWKNRKYPLYEFMRDVLKIHADTYI